MNLELRCTRCRLLLRLRYPALNLHPYSGCFIPVSLHIQRHFQLDEAVFDTYVELSDYRLIRLSHFVSETCPTLKYEITQCHLNTYFSLVQCLLIRISSSFSRRHPRYSVNGIRLPHCTAPFLVVEYT